MRQHQKKNVISLIQNNLKQMQKEAKSYLEKHHHSNLPPICSARHYLFHSIDGKSQGEIGVMFGGQGQGQRSGKQEQQSQGKQKSNQRLMEKKARTSIYNLQFAKKNKIIDTSPSYSGNKNLKTSLMNSTSLRLKMTGQFRTSRYLSNLSSRSSIQVQSNQKLKTIIMNTQIISLAEKDLKTSINTNSFNPRLTKLSLPKKQTDVLQKYISRFKQLNSEQIRASASKISDIANKSAEILQTCLNKQILANNEHCSKRKKVKRITIDNPQSGRIPKKSQLQLQLLRVTRLKKKNKRQLDMTEGEYTPWGSDQKIDQFPNYDFS